MNSSRDVNLTCIFDAGRHLIGRSVAGADQQELAGNPRENVVAWILSGAMIFTTVLSVNYLGGALRNALDVTRHQR
jgi:ABC-type dipeptide/oligopeptide/nickel transport system permease subunit